jgi:hypothetical protein
VNFLALKKRIEKWYLLKEKVTHGELERDIPEIVMNSLKTI